MDEIKIETTQDAAAVAVPEKRSIWHKLFGTTPGDGEMQPKEGIAYSLCGFGQNLICTIIGSYLTVFMTDAIGYGALAVALLDHGFYRGQDAHSLGQMPSLPQMDGDPRCSGDHPVLPAVVSE